MSRPIHVLHVRGECGNLCVALADEAFIEHGAAWQVDISEDSTVGVNPLGAELQGDPLSREAVLCERRGLLPEGFLSAVDLGCVHPDEANLRDAVDGRGDLYSVAVQTFTTVP